MMRMSTHSRPTQRQAGFSLLEVLIATLVLSAGLLGLAGLQIAGMKTTHNSYQMQQATWLVHDLLERMRVNRAGAYAGNYNGTLDGTAACGTAPTCAVVAACTNVEVANIDLFQMRCGTGGVGGLRNDLMGASLTVACLAGGCRSGVNINVIWNERNTSKTVGNNTEQFNINLNAVL
ncbi:type IV pilus modification protein PilV [Candidatus Thiothrix anitrata]|jgi:type IV pilus assembly protein PilV|uniref:Type IV pilus modification protein PilV n=1 Tax=Candidatus Thiothrix anitrata TaxID=2823902 RepID=A0ABX7X154_9GAMM|nr:type IV pilus modification protein PilV [Candidatus Thiothrix anitrata]QTR49336.1 type IV pilus modification protein PilV [Candidatus Thiothrix anitrata]